MEDLKNSQKVSLENLSMLLVKLGRSNSSMFICVPSETPQNHLPESSTAESHKDKRTGEVRTSKPDVKQAFWKIGYS